MQKPDPMIPCKPGAEDIEAMENRLVWLDMLYKFEKRDDPAHAKHGLYTGLHRKHYSTFPGTDEN